DQVFGALETLTRMRQLHGDRLAIICNGIGPALLACDQLAVSGGQRAALAPQTLTALKDASLPTAVPGNPCDLGAGATPDHFAVAFELVAADPNVDAVLLVHVPTLLAPSLDVARRMIPILDEAQKPVLTSWMGFASASPAREAFGAAGVSTFDTPEQAVDAFAHMVKYRRNQEQLEQLPVSSQRSDAALVNSRRAWAVAGAAQYSDERHLDGARASALLGAAGIAVDDAAALEVDALLTTLQVRAGITRDPVFGPLVFLQGAGPHSEPVQRQVALPPLDTQFARSLIAATGLRAALERFSADAARDEGALADLLVRLCALVLEVKTIADIDLYPIVVGAEGIACYGTRVDFGEACEPAILPYPAELEEALTLPRSGRQVVLRPIRGDDAPAHAAFTARLSPQAIRYRLFGPRTRFTRRQLAQATQIDYAREMAFIASGETPEGEAETLGVVRAWTDPDNVSAE
ncbi:MAG: acetate--CoA ligase family protein, partial [Pseudomonadota bacterium]